MRLQRYCSCGARLDVALPAAKRDAALAIWREYHSGVGHSPVMRKQTKEATHA